MNHSIPPTDDSSLSHFTVKPPTLSFHEMVDQRRPLTVAHGAGNDRRRLLAALKAGIDIIEADVWRHRGNLVARHEHGMSFLPFVYDKWYMRLSLRKPPSLAEMVDAARGDSLIMLDLKGRSNGFLKDLLRFIDEQGLAEEIVLSSQRWELLDEARKAIPVLPICYSIDNWGQLSAFKNLLAEGKPPAAISIRHLRLSQGLIRAAKGQDVAILAWTVDDPKRAHELVSWGVDGIISNSLSLLASLKRAATSGAGFIGGGG